MRVQYFTTSLVTQAYRVSIGLCFPIDSESHTPTHALMNPTFPLFRFSG